MGKVLVVDDERGIRTSLEVLVEGLEHEVRAVGTLREGIEALEGDFFDLVITDLHLSPTDDGMDIVRCAREKAPPPEVIVMTAYGNREKAQAAIGLGASFYLEKGPHLAPDIGVLISQAITKRQLEAENERLRRELVQKNGLENIIGRSDAMREVVDIIERVGPLKVTILITGESGTGKERVARALHALSFDPESPFIPVNCGAIPENLIESELFGHVEGAFTGADQDKPGLFQAAAGGTIFLDEVGELPLSLQPKLLRVLQERKVKRVGATQEEDVDVRVVAATNRDLESEAEAGRFREDLYFRLNVVQVDIPPLRRRSDDVPPLVQHFLQRYSKEYGRTVYEVEPEAMKLLLDFRFPGNVRQLQNVIERGVALARGTTLTVDDLPREIRKSESRPTPAVSVNDDMAFPDDGVDLERMVHDFELKLVDKAMQRAGGVKTKAAELLGLSFRQFRYKLSKLREDS